MQLFFQVHKKLDYNFQGFNNQQFRQYALMQHFSDLNVKTEILVIAMAIKFEDNLRNSGKCSLMELINIIECGKGCSMLSSYL